jgi:hypothetical protein
MENEKSCITFVTSYINIYETHYDNRDVEWRTRHFSDIMKTGIQLYVFISPEYEEVMTEISKDYPNVILKTIDFKSMETCTDAMNLQPGTWDLPSYRNEGKDTNEYILLMNAKTEFLKKAIDVNHWGSTHFSWIDFNIAYIFKEKEKTLEYLRLLAHRQYADTCLTIPGCWGKLPPEDVGRAFDLIHWRFCGGFFLGDRDSIVHFYDLYRQYFPEFLKESHRLVWEVNFWAWLEAKCDWHPTWFLAGHDDTIIFMSADIFTKKIYDVATFEEYSYPYIHEYYPTSASYVYHDGKHLLNTRYVSYWLMDTGAYFFHHPDRIIENKNLISELDENMQPMTFYEMTEKIDMPSSETSFSRGLEDIRLYSINGLVKFIATTVSYSLNGRNMMMNGVYDVDTCEYRDCKILKPPGGDSWCEKNWIPLVIKDAHEGADTDEEYFIYKWSPLEVGKVNPETDTLEITHSYPIQSPLFHKVRGSAPFVETDAGLLGIVHLSEEHGPRHYYHIMVLLDKETFRPIKYSRTFCFRTLGVEFCVGMRILGEKYVFWISRHDRDPMLVRVDMAEIPLLFDFI